MTRIGVRELRQHASRYLDLVKSGESVEVTERGVLIAVLTPPTPAQTVREQLIAEGKLIPARGPRVLPERMPARPGTPTLSQLLDEQRAERL